jgi:hypothetical protein
MQLLLPTENTDSTRRTVFFCRVSSSRFDTPQPRKPRDQENLTYLIDNPNLIDYHIFMA